MHKKLVKTTNILTEAFFFLLHPNVVKKYRMSHLNENSLYPTAFGGEMNGFLHHSLAVIYNGNLAFMLMVRFSKGLTVYYIIVKSFHNQGWISRNFKIYNSQNQVKQTRLCTFTCTCLVTIKYKTFLKWQVLKRWKVQIIDRMSQCFNKLS